MAGESAQSVSGPRLGLFCRRPAGQVKVPRWERRGGGAGHLIKQSSRPFSCAQGIWFPPGWQGSLIHTHLLHPGPPEGQVPAPIECGGQEEPSRPFGPPLHGVTGPRFTARRWLGWDDENVLCREPHASPAAVPARHNLGVSLCRV